MWMREIAGFDLYHLVAGFCIFSMLGWLVESIYMSFCNRKITNRGFMTSPFCPIYGFGAVLGYLILHPLEKNIIVLYLVGAIVATIFEFLVGRLMIRLFGELWWDYNDKPFNYKGILCLESTIAWGFYAVIIICFLFDKVMQFVDNYSMAMGIRVLQVIFFVVGLDFVYHFIMATNMKNQLREKKQEFKEFCLRIIK